MTYSIQGAVEIGHNTSARRQLFINAPTMETCTENIDLELTRDIGKWRKEEMQDI